MKLAKAWRRERSSLGVKPQAGRDASWPKLMVGAAGGSCFIE